MVHRVLLTPEYVDGLEAPPKGEAWVADAALLGFGVRLWAGKRGGSARYAIRARDRSGRIVRESFSVWSDQSWRARHKAYNLIREGNFDPSLGLFLGEAREWARDRLTMLRGGLTREQRRHRRYAQAAALVESYSLDRMAEMAFTKLRKSGRKDEYVIQLMKLFASISPELRQSTLAKIRLRKLAEEIAAPTLPFGQSKALQAFVGHLFARAKRWHGPLGRAADVLNRAIYAVRRKRKEPRFPEILLISNDDTNRLFRRLESESQFWRQALAIRLYFETRAKMRRVLGAEWDQIIDGVWYPYSPSQRRHWYLGREFLNESARATLDLAMTRLRAEGLSSAFVFPKRDASGPITTIHRYWYRLTREFGWVGLPLSHVVQRYKERNTPSYTYMCYYFYAPMERRLAAEDVVSKDGKLFPKNANFTVG